MDIVTMSMLDRIVVLRAGLASEMCRYVYAHVDQGEMCLATESTGSITTR